MTHSGKGSPGGENWRCDETWGHGHSGVFWLFLPSHPQERHAGFSDSPGNEVSNPCPHWQDLHGQSQDRDLGKRQGALWTLDGGSAQKAAPRGMAQGTVWQPHCQGVDPGQLLQHQGAD